MKKSKAIVIAFIIILVISIPLTINAFTEVLPDMYKPDKVKESDVGAMYRFSGVIAGAIQIIGTAVSVGTMIIIGIRYVMASADEKAEYKERMFPYFIGAVLLFGATNLVNILYKMFFNIE